MFSNYNRNIYCLIINNSFRDFNKTVFAEKLSFGVEDAADRVKYAVNRAFNEQDRAGK